MRGLALACVFVAFFGAGRARADVVSPPPERCPGGSKPVEFCHGPPTCRALTCETDADCSGGMVCRDARICTTEYCCSGRCCGGGCGSEPTVYTHVFGPCDSSGGCADFGAACTMQKVCVRGTSTDAGLRDAGPTGTDAGRRDGGETGADAGGRDAGRAGVDAGRRDAGRARDAGTSGTPAGGCCSVAGRDGNALGGVLFALAVALAPLLRRRRRRE